MLWKTMYVTFKWCEVRYDMIARICFALMNYHAGYMPLRKDDITHYRSVLARYQSMVDEAKEKRARSQQAYRMRRDERLSAPSVQSSPSRRMLSTTQRPAPFRRVAHEEAELSQAF
ncbi:hypothetical protein PF004_g235 [Phytophthora fragariae]|uniref:Uncharacterized protein n=2 Tax=Phytophthora fragariae TaxID=53985 RepID=A0A6G0PW11_9STRA|nr:hypothetical protein PF004_g235 [Phytophthora fragariae]